MLNGILKRLIRGESLDQDQTAGAVGTIMDGDATAAQIAAFLVAMRMKGETVDEISGAAQAMRKRMSGIKINRRPLIDTCGTGGDGAGTFNISTAVAFVVAAGGVGVAKHGNRAISSRSGSSDVLAELGVNITADANVVIECIEEVGLGFLFAPNCHPAMKHAAPVRKELGLRTIFNLLGPLTNPAGAPRQLIGVFAKELVRPMAEVLGRLGCERAWVVHGNDGLDEITTCDSTHVAEWTGSEVLELTISPEDVGLSRTHREGLKGGTPKENASIMRELLGGERKGPLRDIVALNAGAALYIAGVATDLEAGVRESFDILDAARGLALLDEVIRRTRR